MALYGDKFLPNLCVSSPTRNGRILRWYVCGEKWLHIPVGSGRMLLWAFCSETWPNFCYMGTAERPLEGLAPSMYVHKVYEYVLPVLGTVIRTKQECRGLYRAGVISPN